MSDLEEHIKRINEKLQMVLKRHALLQKENTRMKQELTEIRKQAEDKNNYASLLEQRIEVLKVTRTQMTDEEKKDLEKRIRQYLKEIDKCINFMNE